MSERSRRKRGGGCPICGNVPKTGFKPFCSKRCADVDLHRWLGGTYRIETNEPAPALPVNDDEDI